MYDIIIVGAGPAGLTAPTVDRQAQAASMIIEYFKEYSNQK